jgi:glycine hydroxymethyltransferase
MVVTHTLDGLLPADVLGRQDPELAEILLGELDRQSTTLQLIAAENFTSPAVLAALGSPLANKYAEGYPGARHHSGCELVDVAERLAVERAKVLFGAEHANVQSHSGSSAVLAAYAALLRPGDTVLALGLPHGGHLTHGSPANFSGRWFDFVGYGVDPESGLIDYEQVRALARTHRPKAIVCGSISYPRHIDYAAFRAVADEVGAYIIADAAHPIGLVAGGAAPSPVPYADVVCATTHKVLRGPRGGMLLCGTELAERVDRAVFPFTQGGAQMHTIAAKADVRPSGRRQRPGARGGADRRGPRRHHGRHRHPPADLRPSTARRGRPQRPRPPCRRRPGPRHLRTAPPGRARTAPGDGRRHHAGHGRGGDGPDRGTVRRRAA